MDDQLTADEIRYVLGLVRAEMRRVEAEAAKHPSGPVRNAFRAAAEDWRRIIAKLEGQALRTPR